MSLKSVTALQPKTYNKDLHSTLEMEKRENFKLLGRSLQTEEAVGTRLDQYLALQYPFKQRLEWRQAVVEGRVRVKHGRSPTKIESEAPREQEARCLRELRIVKRHYRVQLFDQLFMYFPEEPGERIARPGVEEQVQVLHVEGDLVALQKPAHLVVHPTGLHRFKSLHDVAADLGFKEHLPVHRLDRETSGVVLAVRSREARAAFHYAFRTQKMAKMYLCIVRPMLKAMPQAPLVRELPHSYRVTAGISNLPGELTRIKRTVEGGHPSFQGGRHLEEEVQSAATTFVRLARLEECGHELIACMPETGRTHQLRVHLAGLGYWIVGDKVYHEDERLFHRWRDDGDTPEILEVLQHSRQLLHHAAIQGPPSLAPLSIAQQPVVAPLPIDMLEHPSCRPLLVAASHATCQEDDVQKMSEDVIKAVWDRYLSGAFDDSPVVL